MGVSKGILTLTERKCLKSKTEKGAPLDVTRPQIIGTGTAACSTY